LRLDIYLRDVKYRESFIISTGRRGIDKELMIKVSEDGVKGWGEAPLPHCADEEYLSTLLDKIQRNIEGIRALEPYSLEKLHFLCRDIGDTRISMALQLAFIDLFGKKIGLPAYRIFGAYRDKVETDITISLLPPEEQAERASRFVEMGFRTLKVKLGLDPIMDVERVRRVREAVGEEIRIRVDVNQGWSYSDALYALNKITDYEVELVEQPLDNSDLKNMAKLRREFDVPFALDESVWNTQDVKRAIEMDAMDVANIKLVKCGGYTEAMRIIDLCEAYNINCMIGCMGCDKIGISAATHLALSRRNIQFYDLDCDLLHMDDDIIMGGALVEIPYRHATTSAGFGISKVQEESLIHLKTFR